MRKLFYLPAVALVTGCASLPLNSFSRTEYSVDELKVRNSTGAVYTGSEEMAVERMMDEAVKSPEEDLWLAVYNKDGTSHFIDIGEKAGKDEYSISIIPDEKFLRRVVSGLPEGTKVRVYHIHPFSEEDDSPYLENRVDVPAEPSMFDFMSYLARLLWFRESNKSVEVLPDRVVGVAGYAEYWASEDQFVPAEFVGTYSPETANMDRKSYDDKRRWSILSSVNNAYNYANAPRVFSGGRKPDEIFNDVVEGLNSRGLKTEYKKLRDTPESLKIKAKARNIRGGK